MIGLEVVDEVPVEVDMGGSWRLNFVEAGVDEVDVALVEVEVTGVLMLKLGGLVFRLVGVGGLVLYAVRLNVRLQSVKC